MNLVVNARDAMPSGGKLTIEASEVSGAESVTGGGATPGPYLMLAITDTGVGMDAATRERMFDPFFTTKEQGKGTGLGLATVFGIVKQSQGHISVQSQLGQGTTIRVFLPRTERPADVNVERDAAQPPVTLRGTETVLLVEDEEQVRVLVRELLRRSGYQVLEAQNGGEALLICEQWKGDIQLLVTDMVMPRMSGRQVRDRLQPLRPSMRTLFISGYAAEATRDPSAPFLDKPITPESLLRKVREVLDV